MTLGVALAAAWTLLPVFQHNAQAQGPDKTMGMDCWNNQFYNGTNGFFDTNLTGTNNGFWVKAEMIELLEDAAANNSKYNSYVSAEITSFNNTFGTNWLGNAYNDDICWAVLAYQRAGQTSIAKSNFDAMWSRAYDTNLIQGLWWNTSKGSKNACVNGPGCIAAARLGEMSNANLIWNGFESNSRVVGSNYAIADHMNSDGSVDWTWLSYNQGTLIGSAMATGHYNFAGSAVTQSVNGFGTPIRVEGTGDQDMAGARGIFARYAGEYAGAGPYLTNMANMAWNTRNSNGVTAGTWTTRTNDGTQYAWECSAAAAMEEDYTTALPNGRYEIVATSTGNCLQCASGSGADGAAIIVGPYTGQTYQLWQVTNLNNGYYSIISSNGGRSLDCSSCSPNDNTLLDLWDYWAGSCQQWQINPTSGPVYRISTQGTKSDGTNDVLDGQGCSGATNTRIGLWSWDGGSMCQQQWTFVAR